MNRFIYTAGFCLLLFGKIYSQNLPKSYLHHDIVNPEMMKINANWIEMQMNSGATFYDIGPRNSFVSSPFYNMEQARTMFYPNVINLRLKNISFYGGNVQILRW